MALTVRLLQCLHSRNHLGRPIQCNEFQVDPTGFPQVTFPQPDCRLKTQAKG